METKTNLGNTNETTFGQDILAMVHNRTNPVGVSDWTSRVVALNVTPTVKRVAEALNDTLSVRGISVGLTDSDIENFLTNLVRYRVLQICRELPRGVVAKEVPVPDFFRPVLARIGRYEDPSRALNIELEWNRVTEGDAQSESEHEGGVSDPVMEYDQLLRIARRLKAAGVRFTNGLPGVLIATDDSIFRICEGSDGELLVAGPDVTEVDLLVRSIVRMSFLADIFGAARTRYLSVEDLRASWEAVVSTAL